MEKVYCSRRRLYWIKIHILLFLLSILFKFEHWPLRSKGIFLVLYLLHPKPSYSTYSRWSKIVSLYWGKTRRAQNYSHGIIWQNPLIGEFSFPIMQFQFYSWFLRLAQLFFKWHLLPLTFREEKKGWKSNQNLCLSLKKRIAFPFSFVIIGCWNRRAQQ